MDTNEANSKLHPVTDCNCNSALADWEKKNRAKVWAEIFRERGKHTTFQAPSCTRSKGVPCDSCTRYDVTNWAMRPLCKSPWFDGVSFVGCKLSHALISEFRFVLAFCFRCSAPPFRLWVRDVVFFVTRPPQGAVSFLVLVPLCIEETQTMHWAMRMRRGIGIFRLAFSEWAKPLLACTCCSPLTPGVLQGSYNAGGNTLAIENLGKAKAVNRAGGSWALHVATLTSTTRMA